MRFAVPKVRTINCKRRSVSVAQYGKWMKVGLGFGGWAVPNLADYTGRLRLKCFFFFLLFYYAKA